MNTPLLLSIFTATVLSAATSTRALAADPPAKTINVLLIDGQNNHDWETTTPVLKKALESTGRFLVDVSTTPAKGTPAETWQAWKPGFANYGAVLSNYNGQPWPDAVRADFEKYVRGGGGFVCVHAANNAFPEWLEYNKMIGLGGWGGRNEKHGPYLYIRDGQPVRDPQPGTGGAHGPQHEFVIQSLDKAHPITAGMPATWKHAKDELYDSLRGPAENVQVLAYARSARSGRDEPMIMTVAYGAGRVFHTPMGHADYSMRCVGFQSVLQRGTEWAATGKVTIPLLPNFPTADATSTVEEKLPPGSSPPRAK